MSYQALADFDAMTDEEWIAKWEQKFPRIAQNMRKKTNKGERK